MSFARISVALLLGAAALVTAPEAQAQGPCRDPWVSQAVREVTGRDARGNGELGECNINLYGARWSSYGELKGLVQQTFAALQSAQLEFMDNGRGFEDKRYFQRIFGTGYAGPRSGAPGNRNWTIALPNGYVLQVNRRCSPGFALNTSGNGCVRGS